MVMMYNVAGESGREPRTRSEFGQRSLPEVRAILAQRIFFTFGCIITILCLTASSRASTQAAPRDLEEHVEECWQAPVSPRVSTDVTGPYRPGAILVSFHAGTDLRKANAILTEHGFIVRSQIEQIGIVDLSIPAGKEQLAINILCSEPNVAFAEVDHLAHAAGWPNDPAIDSQWALPKIEAPAAWGIITATEASLIAFLDSGVDLDHPDLLTRIWSNPGEIPANGIDDDGNGKIDDLNGWHFYHFWAGGAYLPAEDAEVEDDYGHGTHTAGVAAAATDNGIGIAGLAWGATAMPVKVLDEYGTGWYSDVAAGIVYAVDNGARILNLSLGGSEPSVTLQLALDYAEANGALVIAAAGNSGGPVLYPAAYDSTLAVAATDTDDQPAGFSNFGPEVDLAAPGVDIYSTWYRARYLTRSGTSVAAAHVSGAAALVWSYRPELTAGQVREALQMGADRVGDAFPNWHTGWGRLNAKWALVRHSAYFPIASHAR